MQQEVVLALLAKEPSHGYQLRARLRQALGPLGDAMNDGHIYVTLPDWRRRAWWPANRQPRSHGARRPQRVLLDPGRSAAGLQLAG